MSHAKKNSRYYSQLEATYNDRLPAIRKREQHAYIRTSLIGTAKNILAVFGGPMAFYVFLLALATMQ